MSAMSKLLSFTRIIAFCFGALVTPTLAFAMVGEKLDLSSISDAETAEVKSFINNEVREDLKVNFQAKIQELAKQSSATDEPMSDNTKKVLLRGAYLALSARSAVPINEEYFNRSVGKVLDWARFQGLLPHAITIGVLARKTFGEGYTAGFNLGAEMNLYLQDGKVIMTNYALKGGQMGVGSTTSDVEYYAALCFGSCFGGDPGGWYMGVDANLTVGAGAGFFAELGIDVSAVYRGLFKDKKFTTSDLYQASTLYFGFGIDVGVGADSALGLYRYDQIGLDHVLANPGQALSDDAFLDAGRKLDP
jgi:hypothetical protein